MKILLQHVKNTLNYGSMMMAENLITYLNKIYNEKIYYEIDSTKQEDLDRLKEATGYEDISFQKTRVPTNISKVKKILDYKKYMHNISNEYDYIIFLGGDDFSELYAKGQKGKLYIIWNLLGIKYLNKNKNVILLGQTIGPYTGIRKKMAKKVFKDIKVITRDDCNLETMKKEYDINAIQSRDLAFLDLNLQEKYQNNSDKILSKYKLEKNNYLTIVGTGLYDLYCNDENIFFDGFMKIISKLKDKFPNKRILWLSHVTTDKPAKSDNTLLEKLQQKFPDEFKNIVCISQKILPVEARILLGNGYLTVTCRMHAAVSTFQMGKPAICLAYSPKFKGVIAEGLKQEKLVIYANTNDFWSSRVEQEMNEKISYVVSNYDNICIEAKKNVDECKRKVISTLENLLKKN